MRNESIRCGTRLVQAALVLVILALGASPSPARRKPAPPDCSGRRFLVDGAALVIGASATSVDAIAIDGGRISFGQCSAPLKLKAKKGRAKLRAAVRGCPGIKGKVKVAGTVDAACGVVSGFLKTRKAPRTAFRATLSFCGDQRLDPGNGEECDGNAGCSPCDATACRCLGDRKPVASGVSLAVDPALPYVEQQLIATDPDGDTLVYELASAAEGPGYEQAWVNPDSGRFYLTVTPSFSGSIELAFRASDGQLFSDPADISIQVAPSTGDSELGRIAVEPERYAGFPHSTYDGDLLGAPGEDATAPRAVDLSALFPTPGRQGNQSSCVGWSTAYALKSYQEGREIGWSLNTGEHLFSPAYIYNQINGGVDRGSSISDALELITTQGVATWATMPYTDRDYLTQPGPAARAEAAQFKALRFGIVTSARETKAALTNRAPVVVGIDVYQQLKDLVGPNSVYNTRTGRLLGGHAVTIVGYDDDRYGGAFKVINSWGADYGDGGFFWLPYDFIGELNPDAYVLEDAPNTGPVGPVDPTRPPPTGDLPNLQVISWTATYDPKPRGEGLLRYRVGNTGTGVAGRGADVNLMLSRDATFSGNDLYVVYEEIPFDLEPGGYVFRDDSNPIAFTFPDTVQAGDYYMGVWVDDLQELDESNENDNVSPASTRVVLQNDLPDLSVDSWFAQTYTGGTGTLTYRVANVGNAPAPAGWDVNLVLSVDQAIGNGDEIYLFFEENPSPLPAGNVLFRDANNAASFSLKVDAYGGTVPTGLYYAALWVDDVGEVEESNELNNASLYYRLLAAGALAAPQASGGAASGEAIPLYNGKTLPSGSVAVRRIRISDGPDGSRQAQFLDDAPAAPGIEARARGLFAKQARSANRVLFPMTHAIPMPD